MDKETFWTKLAAAMADPAVRADYDEVAAFINKTWFVWRFCESLDSSSCLKCSKGYCETLFVKTKEDLVRPHDPLKCRMCDSMAVMGPGQLLRGVETKETKHGGSTCFEVQSNYANLPTLRSFCFWVAMEDRVMPFVQPTDSEPLIVFPDNLNVMMTRLVCDQVFSAVELPENGGLLMFLLSRGVEVVHNFSTRVRHIARSPGIEVYMRHPQRIRTWDFIEQRHLKKLRNADKR